MNMHARTAPMTPQQVRNDLRRISRAMVQSDPLARLLMLLADADLSCRNELWPDDFDSAEMAIEELPDAFQLTLDGIQDAFDGAKA